MLYTALFSLFFAHVLPLNEGLRQSGVSLNLPSNIPVKSTGWYKIKGWQSPIDSGHAVIGTKLKAPENADVFVPHSGIYLAYVTVTLTGANIEGRFKVKLLVNDKVNSSHSGMSSSTLGGPLGPKSLSFKGAILLQASDYVSVHVYSEIDTDWSISGQSETTLSLQYIEALGVAPGFSAIIERTTNYNSSGWNSLKYWHYEGEPGLFKSMTGFSKHIGEFAAICDGIYIITANVHIKTDATNYFDLGIAVDSIVNGSIIRNPAFKEFTLSISVSISLRKGQLVSLKINSQGSVFTVGTESAFTATRIRSDSATVPGFSTVLRDDIHGEGARWTQISLQKPNGTSFGQFQGETKYITGGSYYPPENGMYIVSANIRIVAESLISACIFTRLDSASRLTGNIVGVYSTITKTDYAKEVTFNAAGTIELLASQNKLSFFIYMQNSGRYRILAGSRISIIKVEERYPAFHATLEADVPQSSNNAWVEISSWKINRVSGSFSLTKSLSATNGRYSAEVSGIYHVSANMIFNAPASVISLLIAANGDQSKRNALFSTKGNPGSNDFLTVSGSLRLQRGDFVSVMAKVTGTSSWSVADKSSFSLAFIGMPFSVPGFSAVFSSTRSFTSDGWHQMQGLLLPGSSGTMFHYGGGLDAANCKYQVPLPGLYVVSANMKLKSATRVGAKFTVNIGIDNNPGSFSNLNGMNDYISRSTSLGSEDFYSMNAVGVVKLQANQSITLWIKSTSAGSWQLSEDSSFSAVMLHPENTFDSSGLQAVLSLGITQTVTGATNWKIVRSWSTTRSSTEAGLFSLGDYQELSSSSGTIVIRQSGLYFVSASITLKDAVGKFEVGIHLESRLAALYSVIDSRLFSYTVKVTGMLFIAKGQTLSVQVKAPLKMNWEQDVMHCGLSFVKLGPFVIPTLVSSGTTKDSIISLQRETWRRVDNWKTSLTNTQLLLGNGFSKSSGVYKVQNSGVFIISGFLETESTKASPSVEMKISVNGDDTNITTTRPGNGLSTVNSKCNKSCVLFTSGVFSLATLNTVAVFVKSNEALQLKIKNSSMFSVSFVAESFPLPNGMFGQLTSVQTVKVKGNKQITGWQLSPASGNFFGSTGNMDSFYIQNSGIYFVSITIKFRNLVGMTKAFTSLVNIPSITSMLKQDSNSIFSLSVTGCMKINSGSSYTVTVFSETDSDFEILSGSSKSAIFLGTSVIGFTATQSATKSLTLFPGKASVVSGWTILGKDWLFESGSGFHDRISYLVPETGVYYVSSQIIVSLNTNSTEVTLSLGVLLDGFLKRENRLYSSTSVNGLVTETLLISGSLFLQKWTQLKLVMFASRTATVDIGIDSTYSIVKTSKNLRVPPCADNGPNIIGKLDPDDLRTSYRKSVGWQCQAVGQSVSYSWLKNYQPLPGATSQSLQIASTQVSDTGEYICAASQDGIRVTSNIAKLTVYDPVPVFMNQASDYDLITPENGPNSTSIVYIQARARSLDNAFAMMSFEIVSGNVNNTFYLNPTSSRTGTSLFRKIPLDREILANYTITVKATNLEALSIKYQQINITVDDLNDNSPIFTQSKYESFIYENTTIGTTVARVLATDRDIGENSVIKYSFIPSSAKSVFSVNPTTGYVTLDAPIDRETRDLYVIFVKASDKSHSTYSELSIKILDINEHKPVFNKHYYSVNVSETILPGSSIIAVAASDNDTGSNADLTYSIVGGDPANMFRITKYGMIQNKKSLNYEQNKTFTLTVSVRDNGKPPLYSIRTAVVVIGITDANDNSPKFDKGNYIVNVFENQTVGALILTVHAQDNDAPGQPESLLSYAMEEKALQIETFSISSTNGEIKLNKSLDYERINLYRFTVIAKDNGIPSLQDKALVAVNVLDVNDNRPYFKQLYFAVNVTESSQVNREIFKVTATDADAGLNAELRYYLQSGNHGNTFVVDPVAGNVIAMKPLDREKGVFYSLVISCKDMGSPQLEAVAPFRLDIHILDENDNSPRFNLEKYSTKISENTPVGSTILFMNVTDPDEGQNGNFSVSIVENRARSIFEYNQSKGVLVLKKRLDYEVQSKYHFTVIAKDYGIPSLEKSALVDIEVTDVNDNAPRFSQSSYDTQVQDMVYANVTMFQMIATDPDIGPAKRITYEIVSGNVDGQFRIGKYSGIVETTKFLNTTFINMFKLEVVAKDGFNPPAISNRTVLNIHVTKTPAIWLTNLKAGTTSLEATVDVSEFSYLKITDYRILVQLFEPDDPKLNVAASMPPITWYRVNTELSALNKIRRYATLVIPASRLNGTKLSIVIGTESGCHKKPVDVCNGPLTANKKYRIQVRGTTINSKFPRDSHFSTPISLGEPAASVAELVDSGSKDGAIGLAIAFGVSTLLTIFILIGYVQYKRKHQLIEVEHVNKHLELVQNHKYDEQLTPRSGFGALSDIGVWPEMSMAEVSHMFQRSQGPKDHKAPRSPGDSGINHGNDDEESWRLNISDEGEEPWEVREQNIRPRDQNGLLSSLQNKSLQPSRIVNSDSNTSLDTSTERFQLPMLSDSLNFVRSDANKREARVNTKPYSNKVGEEIETEIETEFGPEIETTLGADADLSSIDEEL